jgi:hypothetical protein
LVWHYGALWLPIRCIRYYKYPAALRNRQATHARRVPTSRARRLAAVGFSSSAVRYEWADKGLARGHTP